MAGRGGATGGYTDGHRHTRAGESSAVLTERAPAKVNLFLAVGSRRSDGYHDLLTLFETVPLYDEVRVTIRPGAGPGWVFRASATAPSIAPRLTLPTGLDNLAGRAAERFVAAMLETASFSGPPATIEVSITKRIPVAAGLGGGSSDAAAVFRALQGYYGNPLGKEALAGVAAGLGADVAFFLHTGRAVGRSRGEKIEPVPAGPPLPLVLGLPAFALRTPDVYRRLDLLRPTGPGAGLPGWERPERDLAVLLRSLSSGRLSGVAAQLRNDLQEAALSLRPELAEALKALRRSGCLAALVSGSGPSIFGLAPTLEQARETARVVSGRLPAGLGGELEFVPLLSRPDPLAALGELH